MLLPMCLNVLVPLRGRVVNATMSFFAFFLQQESHDRQSMSNFAIEKRK